MNRQERRKAAKTNSGHFAKQLERGFRQYTQGDLPGAEAQFRQVLAQQPDQPDALRLLGEVFIDQNRHGDAIALLRRLVALQPGQFVAHYTLGNAYRLAGQVDAAIPCYQTALKLNPAFAGAHHGLGAALRQTKRERDAAVSFRLAVEAKPDWAMAWKDLGLSLAVLGELPEAEAALKRAVALQPGLGEAQRHLAAVRRDKAGENEIAALQARATDPNLPPHERIDLLFTLGRLADQAGRFDEAFRHFTAANSLLRATQAKAGICFDRAKLTRDVDRLIATFPQTGFGLRAGWGNASDTPVFIVGMPRAGSTLFEQIAASHSQVFGAGEQRGVGEIAARIGWSPSPAWTEASLSENAGAYLAGLRAVAGNASRIIDKMPDNVFQLGLIATLFPNARVIVCARDRRDVALSCYFQHFSEPLGFDTDLRDCAFRIREIERLTAHWQQALPLRHMVLSYEALLADPEGESRRLIGFLGLDWEPGCLEFHRATREVRTASWAQVRQPLYQSAAGRWRHYAHLSGVL